MGVTLASAAIELLEMRVDNGRNRVEAAIGSIAQGVEQKVPFGREIVGAVGACMLVPLAIVSLVERAVERDS